MTSMDVRAKALLAAIAGIGAAIAFAGTASADARGYWAYLDNNNINTGYHALNPHSELNMGMKACDMLRQDLSIEDIVAGHPFVPFDVRGVTTGASLHLCRGNG